MMTFLRSRWLQESRAGTDDRRAKRRRESHEPSCNAERDVRKPCILMSGSLSFVYYSLQNAPQPRRGRAGLAHLRESRIPMPSEHTQLMVLGLALVRDAASWFSRSLRVVCLGTSMIICMASNIRAFTIISLSNPPKLGHVQSHHGECAFASQLHAATRRALVFACLPTTLLNLRLAVM